MENRLWAELKRLQIEAERQEFVHVNAAGHFLDFAVYCAKGNLDIETDGDKWHYTPARATQDNLRDNDLVSSGWQILRFTSGQINDQLNKYCAPKIVKKVNNLGGISDSEGFVRRIDLKRTGSSFQSDLFDKE